MIGSKEKIKDKNAESTLPIHLLRSSLKMWVAHGYFTNSTLHWHWIAQVDRSSRFLLSMRQHSFVYDVCCVQLQTQLCLYKHVHSTLHLIHLTINMIVRLSNKNIQCTYCSFNYIQGLLFVEHTWYTWCFHCIHNLCVICIHGYV